MLTNNIKKLNFISKRSSQNKKFVSSNAHSKNMKYEFINIHLKNQQNFPVFNDKNKQINQQAVIFCIRRVS